MSMRRSPELRPTVWDGLTALAVLLPTALGLGLCFITAGAARLLGLA